MRQNIKYLIIPDVHGRSFWQRPVEECLSGSDCKIVFLGDYLDPYPYEWEDADTSPALARVKCKEVALDRFKQILDLKKRYPDRVTLLLGNHDCGYAISSDICDCRTDYGRYREIEDLFKDNRELFQLAEEVNLGDRRIVFSHAGILKGWARCIWKTAVDEPGFRVTDRLNNAWLVEDNDILNWLGEYDHYRGWDGSQYGSPVWSDIRSWVRVTPEETFGFNICGHTQLDEPVMLDCIACIDCRRAFYLDEEGILRAFSTGEEVKKHEE